MRIAFFSPLAAESAIAAVSASVAEELAALGHDVSIWAPDIWRSCLKPNVRVIRFGANPLRLRCLDRADICLYAIGNDLRYHRRIIDVATAKPGIVVLHDLVMHHTELRRSRANPLAYSAYLKTLQALYGGAAVAEALAEGRRLSDARASRYPMFEPSLRGALGVVCHSAWQAAEVQRRWPGPVSQLFLPSVDPSPGRGQTGRGARREIRAVSLGQVLENRRIIDLVEALGANPDLAERIKLEVVGPLKQDAPHIVALRARIRQLGLGDRVVLHGWVPTRERDRLLAAADLHINLRDPPFEGASSALLLQFSTGAPVLTYSVGSYTEMGSAVVQVPAGDLGLLGGALRQLVEDPEYRRQVGSEGLSRLRQSTAARYATELVTFVESARTLSPVLALADRAGRALADLGIDGSAPARRAVEDALERIAAAPDWPVGEPGRTVG